jgi:LacI family transcriptional regulator
MATSESSVRSTAKPQRGRPRRVATDAADGQADSLEQTKSPRKKSPSSAPPSQQRPITSSELAALIGVSRTTVSIVLRGDADRRMISAATVQKVLEGVQKYNYTPNPHAQNLRSRRSMSVSVVCSNFALDWADRLLYAMEPAVEAAGYTLFVAAHRSNTERHRRILTAAAQRRDAGVVCMPIPGQEDAYRQLVQSGIPLIFLGDYPASMPHESRVVWDASDAVRTALEHLIAIGRRRIAYVGTRHTLALHVARRTAYAQTLRDAGLSVDPALVVERPDGEREVGAVVAPAMDALLALPPDKRPDAIFCMNDGLAFEVMRQLDLRGVEVPKSIAVAGLGDLPMAADSGIGLTTVAEPVRELGQACVDALNQIVRSQRDVVQQTLGTRPDALRVRRSTVTHAASAH